MPKTGGDYVAEIERLKAENARLRRLLDESRTQTSRGRMHAEGLSVERGKPHILEADGLCEQALEAAHVGISAFDATGKCILANESLGHILGATREQVLSQNFRRLESWKSSGLVDDAKQVLEHGGEIAKHVQVTTTSGKSLDIEYHMRQFWSGGEPLLLVAVIDVTSRRMAEEQSTIFRRFADASEQALGMSKLDGSISYANLALCRIMGLDSVDDVLGTNVGSYYTDEDLKTLNEKIIPQVLEQGHSVAEVPLRSVKGHMTPTIQTVFLIRDTRGNPAYLANVITDITERKRSEEELRRHRDHLEELVAERTADVLQRNRELRESEQRNRLLVESIPLCIYRKDRDSVYLSCNALYARDLGIEALSTIEGRTDEDFFESSLATKYRTDDKRVIETGKTIELEETFARGELNLTIWTIKAPLRDADGEISGVLGMYQDISAQRELEAHLQHVQKMEAIGQLAGGVAHDFNNMLAGIIGAADLLAMSTKDSGPSSSHIELIINSATRAADLTKQLLAFSRKSMIMSVPIDVHDTIDKAVSILSHTIDRRIQLERRFEADVPTVIGDPAQLETVFLNLGVNARDAMPDGGALDFVTKNVELSEEFCLSRGLEKGGLFIEISIRDTGLGMDEETRSHIFEPFYTTKGVGQGTGLGLAAVYGVVRDHQGLISAESHLGAGTEFIIVLPATHERPRIESPSTTAIAQGNGLVLVVDDETVVRETARALIERMGYTVITARDGQECVEIYSARHGAIDIVLLDLVMPRMSGLEAFAEIHRIDPKASVVISSGYSRDARLVELLDAGVTDFVQKPFRSSELARIFRSVLGRRSSSE